MTKKHMVVLVFATTALALPLSVWVTGDDALAASPVSVQTCPEAAVGDAGMLGWVFEQDRYADARREAGLVGSYAVIGPDEGGDGWRYVDAAPVTDFATCQRITEALVLVRYPRPASWEWFYFTVADKVVVLHKPSPSEYQFGGEGLRMAVYVFDAAALASEDAARTARRGGFRDRFEL